MFEQEKKINRHLNRFEWIIVWSTQIDLNFFGLNVIQLSENCGKHWHLFIITVKKMKATNAQWNPIGEFHFIVLQMCQLHDNGIWLRPVDKRSKQVKCAIKCAHSVRTLCMHEWVFIVHDIALWPSIFTIKRHFLEPHKLIHRSYVREMLLGETILFIYLFMFALQYEIHHHKYVATNLYMRVLRI